MKEPDPAKIQQNRSVSCLSPRDPGLICAGMESEIGLSVPGSCLSELKKEEDVFHNEQETSFSSLRGPTEWWHVNGVLVAPCLRSGSI